MMVMLIRVMMMIIDKGDDDGDKGGDDDDKGDDDDDNSDN